MVLGIALICTAVLDVFITVLHTQIESPISNALERIKHLAIPPAWRDVWISPNPLGHIQATGFDRAGRKQYRYHSAWRDLRDREKFDEVATFGEMLPVVRDNVEADLSSGGLGHRRVLGCSSASTSTAGHLPRAVPLSSPCWT